MKKNKHTGGDFDDFLKEEGLYEEVTAKALKKTSMYKLEKHLASKRGLKNKIRQVLKSPSMLERFLSDNPHVEFDTMVRAGLSVGFVPLIDWVPVGKIGKKLKKA
ncbi:MAG: Fis family transcriptional regulator [Oligoflexia bacterium]|nr:Fis family transcriptional regulator [Oligoflexia bacterium]